MILCVFLALTSYSVIASEHTMDMNPVIVDASPENADQSTDLNTKVTATFSKDMSPSSINEDTFLLEQRTTPASGEEITKQLFGSVEYDAATRTAIFTPDKSFQPDQHYGNVFTATITTDVEDTRGNNLQQEYLWSFTTGVSPYNTGDTTSQQNETLTAAAAQAPSEPSSATPNPANTAAEQTVANSPWLSPFAIAAYIFLLLLLAIILLTGSTRKDTAVTTNTNRKDDFGNVYLVEEVEGIGQKFTKELNKIGIKNTKQLWDANTKRVAASINTNAKTVQNWQQMAELMAINGIGPQYAELLERSGVRSVKELAAADSKTLLKRVQKKQNSLDTSIQGNTPGDSIVESWIEAANEHQTHTRAREI